MQILTPSGYVDASTLQVGDDVIGFDFTTNSQVTNTVTGITLMDEQWFIDQSQPYEYFLINGVKEVFYYQSIFKDVSGVATLVHGFMLTVGDSYYDEDGNLVAITSIVSQTTPSSWYRFDIDGNHSYIGDDMVLHNSTRYWVGGGSSQNWNATGNTNWGTASGVQDNASVPTSVDDVIFDGGGGAGVGDSDSTISATITILSLDIQTGYTSTMTHNAVLSVSGNVTLGANYIIAGTSGITYGGASSTFTTNNRTWPNNFTIQGSFTYTFVGNLTILGTFINLGRNTTINATTNEKIICNGYTSSPLNSSVQSGTITFELTGGTWSLGAQVGAFSFTEFIINGNVTISGNVLYNGGKFTYLSGTVTTTGSSVTFNSTTTITSGSIVFNNVIFSGANATKTLVGNLTINGLLTVSGTNTINRTTAETVTCAGGMTINAALSGTADINWTGGTWTQGAVSTYAINNNLTISGNVTFNGANPTYGTGTFTYSSGTVTTTGSTFNISSTCTINSNGITWNNFSSVNNIKTITLTSNITINGLFSVTQQTTINKTISEIITCAGGITLSAGLLGTADISWTGGTWTQGATTYGIANNTTIAGNVTFSGANTSISGGTWTYSSGTVTTTGNTLNIRASCTLNTNGITWNNITFTQANTTTLTSNLSIGGLLTITNATTVNRTTAETITCAGGMTLNAGLSGTAKIILTGGTWSGNNRVSNDVDVNGNITISGSVKFGGLNFNYISGSVTTTSSTFNIDTASSGLTINFNSSAITWNNFGIETALNQTIFVLTSDLTINGLFTANSFTGSINKTTNQIIYANGGYFQNSYVMGGSADIYLQGGTITGQLRLNTYINGNVTFATCSLVSNTKTYLSGTISQTGVVSVGSVTLDMKEGVFPRNVSTIVDTFGTYGITLLSDLNVLGTLIFADSSSSFNTSNASRINVYGGLTHFKSNGGSAPVYLKGGTWSTTATNNMTCNVFIDGNITISGNIYYGTSAITYLSGNVKSVNAILNLTSSCSLLNMNKVKLNAAIVTAGQTITMNQPFVGTEEQICQVSSTGANYTITFTDTFEKIARNVAISGATLSRPMQMIVATNPKFATNRGTNVGMRYNNQSPNGFAKNVFPISDDSLTGVAGGLVSDPCFVRQG